MTKKKDIAILYSLIFIEILILSNSSIVIESVKSTSSMFFTKIFPSLFPTMVIGNILIKEGIHQIIPKFIKNIFKKLFNYNNIMTGLFITSMFCGTPSNAMYINEALNNGLINEKQAEALICSTHFINPLFVIGAVGIGIFNSSKIGILLLLILWTSNFIKAFLNKNSFENNSSKILSHNNTKFMTSFSESVKYSINALLLILGIIIMFSILITLISNIFNLSIIQNTLLYSVLEMTSGIIRLQDLDINHLIKFILTYYILNFGGLCIHMQTLSMITNKKIRYIKYLIFRLF